MTIAEIDPTKNIPFFVPDCMYKRALTVQKKKGPSVLNQHSIKTPSGDFKQVSEEF